MKRRFLLAHLVMSPLLFFGQSSPTQFLSSLPKPPTDVCNSKGEERGEYMRRLNPYADKLKEELKYLTKDEKKNTKKLEEDMTKKVAADFNMSPEEIQQLRNTKKMTKAQRDSLANKLLQGQNMNLTVEDMRKAKDIKTKEGKSAWATSVANEQAAEWQGNPKKINKVDSSGRTAFDISKELDKLRTELFSRTATWNKKMDEIEMDTIRTRKLQDMKELKEIADTLIGDDLKPGRKRDIMMAQLKAMQESYCSEYADKYKDLLSQYYTTLITDLRKYDRIDELLNEQNKKTTGTDVEMIKEGFSAYKAIEQYMDRLLSAYRYSVYDPQWWDNWEASKKTGEEGN